MARVLAYRLQAQVHGDFSRTTLRLFRRKVEGASGSSKPFQIRSAALWQGGALRPGSVLMREWQGRLEQVMVLEEGFAWQVRSYPEPLGSGEGDHRHELERHRFFGLAQKKPATTMRSRRSSAPSPAHSRVPSPAEVHP
jgi:hypothetical protein